MAARCNILKALAAILVVAGLCAICATCAPVASALPVAAANVMVGTTITPCPPAGYTCLPANVSVHTSSNSNSSSNTKIVVKTSLVPQVKQYMTTVHVRVTIDQIPGGVKSFKGCIDPVKKGYIKPGDYFSNTGGRITYRFTDKWPGGDHICDFRVVHDGAVVYLQGTKGSCGNKGIRIFLTPHKFTKYVPVKRFRTVTAWTKKYHKWVSKHKSSTSTSTRSTTYNCNGMSGTLYGDICITPIPGSTPPPPPQLCEVQTAINYGQALPCRYAPPPGNFTATGSTYVNSQKSLSAACPAPNQGIVKSASSDTITISSPTFTGHGSTQSAANQDLANQEASWRTSNQSTADSQATSQAQSRLNSALQSCPQPVQHTCTFSIPPNGKSDNYTASVQMGGDPASSISVNWGDGTVNGSTSHTYPTPSPAPAGTYVYYQVSVTAHYSDGPDASCGTRQYAVEAPPTQPTGGPGGSGAPGKGGG